jgi:tetratricopeptide (TPR) repeat protein
VDDRLRPLWNFDDLDESQARLEAQLGDERSDEERAEVLTQLARVGGLRGDFDAGDRLLDEAVELASGEVEASLPLFEAAFVRALGVGQYFVAADAAHMAALAAPDREGFVAWTERGIAVAEEQDGAAYWSGSLLNNLGWEYYEAGELEPALDAFERALRARERDPENAAAIEIARYAVGKTLRALGRAKEAVPLLEQAVESATQRGTADGWLHEELAEEYAALGRADDARGHARLAIPLLEAADPSFAEDPERRTRLAAIAGHG